MIVYSQQMNVQQYQCNLLLWLWSTFNGLQFCRWQYGSIFIRLAVVASKSTKSREILWKFELRAVQCRPRSSTLVLVPIESAYRRRYREASEGRIALFFGDHDSSHAVHRRNSVVLPDLVKPSLSGSARAAFPLVVGWSAERQVDVAVEDLGKTDVSLRVKLKAHMQLPIINSNFGLSPTVLWTHWI